MLTETQRAEFDRDGFTLVPGVLSAGEVRALREALARLFAQPSKFEGDLDQHPVVGSMRFDLCARHPELAWMMSHAPLVSSLRALFGGEFVFLPEIAAHDSGYGDWHKDTTSQERAGLKFHWERDFHMAEAVLYLQDNDPQYAGGLDVYPGSHRLPDRYRHNIGNTILHRVKDKLKHHGLWPKRRPGYSIPSKAGDLLLFDFRLDHKASWPKIKPVPPDKRKLAIFIACSANNRHAKTYVDYLASRPDYLYLKDHRYPSEVLAALEAQKLIAL